MLCVDYCLTLTAQKPKNNERDPRGHALIVVSTRRDNTANTMPTATAFCAAPSQVSR
jgi:hypothetical protein